MRSAEQRKSDAIEKLEKDEDVWVATAGERGTAHLVPLSLCWHDGKIIVAVESRSRTARNASASGQARLALGTSRDAVMIDAAATVTARSGLDPAIATAYRERTGWQPGADGGGWGYILVKAATTQVWGDVAESTGRTVMRDGACLA